MEKETKKTQESRNWVAGRDQVRQHASQKFKDKHERDKRSPALIRQRNKTVSSIRRRGTANSTEKPNTVRRHGTVSGSHADDPFETQDQDRNENEDATDQKPDNAAEARRKIKAMDDKMNWPERISGNELFDGDQIITRDSAPWDPSKDRKDEGVPVPKFLESDHSVDETSDREHQAVSEKGQTPDQTARNEHKSLKSQPQLSGSLVTRVSVGSIDDRAGGQFEPETNKIGKALETTNSSGIGEHETHDLHSKSPVTDHIKSLDSQPYHFGSEVKSPDPQPKSPETDHIKSLDSQMDQFRSEQVKSLDPKPKSPETDHTKSPDSQPNQFRGEQVKSPDSQVKSLDPQPKFPETDHTKSPDSQPNQFGSEQIKSPDSQLESSETDHDKSPEPQPKSPGIDHRKSPDSQPNRVESEPVKSPDIPSQYPKPGGVTLEKMPAQVRQDLDPKAWLRSDSPLAGNYRAILPHSPSSSVSDSSSSRGSGMDSLIIPPAATVRLPCSK